MISEEELIELIKKEFNSAIENASVEKESRVIIKVKNENIVEIANYIKHELAFTIPNHCVGTDMKDLIEVTWYIGRENSPTLIALKTTTDREESKVHSLTPIWQGFDWHERETYDLVGVNFEDHPDLRRILMPENWEGYPLREDYVYKKPIYRKPEDL